MTTYEQMCGKMECPVCGKPLMQSDRYDLAMCSEANCSWNNHYNFNIYETLFKKENAK